MFLTPKKEEYFIRVEIRQQQRNCEELEVVRFLRLTQASFVPCARRVNFHHFEMSPSLLH